MANEEAILRIVCMSDSDSAIRAYLDVPKAFDRVWIVGLLYLIWNNGIEEKVWRLLKEMYSTVNNKVVLGDLGSEWFNQDNGVKQGCILSPSLFSVMMKDLTDILILLPKL